MNYSHHFLFLFYFFQHFLKDALWLIQIKDGHILSNEDNSYMLRKQYSGILPTLINCLYEMASSEGWE